MTPAVLKPFSPHRAGRRMRPASLLFVLSYSAITGALVALLPAQLLFLLAIPLLVAVVVILWLLPEGAPPPVALLTALLVWFIGANTLWPSYISVDLPGLPWINPQRIVAFALLTVALWSYSTSGTMRAEIAEILRTVPFLRVAFWLFWATTVITLAFSSEIGMSLNKWFNNQIFWTGMFGLAAWLGTKGGAIERVVRVILWTTILVSLEVIYEFHIGQVPWLDHIPSFMTVDQAYLVNVLKSQGRAGTDIYRAHGTFTVSLVCAEYLAIIFPFLIHELVIVPGLFRKLLMFAGSLAALSAMWLTNARSAMIGFFIAVFLYGGFAAYRYWRRQRQSLIGVSALAMMPIAAMIFLALAITWPRLHTMTFGGSQHQPSSLARDDQWAMGLPKIRSNPVGYGVGRSGQTLGYANLGGQLTIDTYYLSLVLEYGVLGYAAFMAMFLTPLFVGLKLYLRALPGEESMAGPIAIALLNFIVIKAVSSTEFNMPLAFVLLGFLVAVAWRQQQRIGIAVPARMISTRGYRTIAVGAMQRSGMA
ncbi:MAG: O-antigen ligase family protein [Pseudomonadota bacterium]|nr:O-antigen ligase family protein [Pseudomonadota bacterium]